MESRSHALMAGLFVLALLVAVLACVWWLNRDTTETIPYEVVTKTSVTGLNPEAIVRYRGIEVGKVKSIQFDKEVLGQVNIHLEIIPTAPIMRSTFATMEFLGVTGLAYIELDDDGTDQTPLETSKENIARIKMRPGFVTTIEDKSAEILEDVQKITSALADTLDAKNKGALTDTLKNINKAAQELEKVAQQLQPTLEKLPSMATKANNMMDSVAELSKNINEITQNLSSTMKNNPHDINQIQSLADELKTSLQSINMTLDQFNQNPPSLLMGGPRIVPGPGEAGYKK